MAYFFKLKKKISTGQEIIIWFYSDFCIIYFVVVGQLLFFSKIYFFILHLMHTNQSQSVSITKYAKLKKKCTKFYADTNNYVTNQ